MNVTYAMLAERRKQLEGEVKKAFSDYHYLRGALFEVSEMERYAEIPSPDQRDGYAEGVKKAAAELERINVACGQKPVTLSGV